MSRNHGVPLFLVSNHVREQNTKIRVYGYDTDRKFIDSYPRLETLVTQINEFIKGTHTPLRRSKFIFRLKICLNVVVVKSTLNMWVSSIPLVMVTIGKSVLK